MDETEIVVGGDLSDAIADVGNAWKAAERGIPITPTSRTYVRDWATLYALLTPARYALLRHLRRSPVRHVRELGEALGRDPISVEADVAALEDLGLIERSEDGGLSSDVDEIASTIRVAA